MFQVRITKTLSSPHIILKKTTAPLLYFTLLILKKTTAPLLYFTLLILNKTTAPLLSSPHPQ